MLPNVWQSNCNDDAADLALVTLFSGERRFKSQHVAMRAIRCTHINVLDGRLRINNGENLCGWLASKNWRTNRQRKGSFLVIKKRLSTKIKHRN